MVLKCTREAKLYKPTIVILAAAFAVTPTQAQDFGGVWDVGAVSSGQALKDSLQLDAERRGAGRVGSGLALSDVARQSPSANARAASLRYAPTPALKREVLSAFLERVRADNPRNAEAAERAFAQHDYGRIYQGIVAPFGLGGNDAADSLTAYMVLGWMIANGEGDPSRSAVRAARGQVSCLLRSNHKLS